MLAAEEIENWNAGYATGFGGSAPLTRKVSTIAAGFSGVIAGIVIVVYLVAGWVD